MKLCEERVWLFTQDMNFDGVVNLSDIWLWIKWAYFFPGDSLAYIFFCENLRLPSIPFRLVYKIAEFIGVSPSLLELGVSLIFSFFSWLILIAAVCIIPKDIKELFEAKKEKKKYQR